MRNSNEIPRQPAEEGGGVPRSVDKRVNYTKRIVDAGIGAQLFDLLVQTEVGTRTVSSDAAVEDCIFELKILSEDRPSHLGRCNVSINMNHPTPDAGEMALLNVSVGTVDVQSGIVTFNDKTNESWTPEQKQVIQEIVKTELSA